VTGTGWLAADSLWWDGRLHTGGALELRDGVVTGMAAEPGAGPLRRLSGTLLPGLCDFHVHSALVDLEAVRAGGIAAVWDLGGVPAVVTALRDRAAQPGSGLPRMTVAGPFLTAPGGYPSDRSWAPAGSWREVRSAADAAEAVGECRAAGAELIKVTAHTGGPTLPGPVLAAVVAAAHGAGLRVVVHAEGPGTVEAAVDAAVDLLAHTPWTQRVDDGTLRAAADQGMGWISTLDIHGWGRPSPELGAAVDNLRRFLGYGGSVRYGTDLGNGPLVPGVNPREIRALQRAGLTPEDVLAAMTVDTAGLPPSLIADGLDLDGARFADVLATARVVDAEPHPG
jgi:imidazolonepropionase-like amidohydrolase